MLHLYVVDSAFLQSVFSNIFILNPDKTLALGINYLTGINLSSALEFYLNFPNAFFVCHSYTKTRSKEEYAN